MRVFRYLRELRTWGVLALAGLAGVLVAVAVASSSRADVQRVNLFAGEWAPTQVEGGLTGKVDFSVISPTQGISDIQAMGGSPCQSPTTYYHGVFSDNAPESGTMTICTVAAGHAVGRYLNDNTQLTYRGGDLNIALTSATSFSGFYTSDDPSLSGHQFSYSGTFSSDFAGDGCCVTTTTTGTTTTTSTTPDLNPPTAFCPPGAHAISAAGQAPDPPCAPLIAATPAEKAQAAGALELLSKVFIVTCVLGEEYGISADACALVFEGLLTAAFIKHDPPDSHFGQVALPLAPAPPKALGRCPKGISKSACAKLKAAELKYAASVATTGSYAVAYAIALDRFSGALQANSPSGAFLQGAAGKVYAGGLASALSAQDAAGRALGRLIRNDHVDRHLNGKRAAAQARHKISNAALDALVSNGLASSRGQARSLLAAQLKRVSGNLDVARAFGAQFATGALRALYRSITLRELAATVSAFAAQGTIPQSAGQALISDLGQAQLVCSNSSQLAAAIAKFDADAAAQTSRIAASMLRLGAGPLAAGHPSASACA